ncbi:MAG TPA: LruC domain-containing protein [Spirochaetota bacterium]|nr:LruC domain-containing protein [Spirochaetota bacterium]HPJ43649.1 LruC domain-containing protein [Spirochaetota bacterium]
MRGKTAIVIAFTIMVSSLFFISCGGSGGGGNAAVPEVIVTTDNSGITGDSSSASGGNPGSADGTIGINNGINSENNGADSEQDVTQYVVIILTDDSGNLNINYEKVSSDSYNASTITATDENGQTVAVSIEQDGSIKIIPSDGTVEGVYTVVIRTDEREYLLVVSVDDNKPAVVSSISYPSGNSMILNLDNGVLSVNSEDIIISSGGYGNYTEDLSISSIAVTDNNGNIISVKIDPVTGDLITDDTVAFPCNVLITVSDGRIIILQTDSTGKITGNVAIAGRAVIVDLNNGAFSASGINLTLTSPGNCGWSLADGVQILSAMAGDGTIQVASDRIQINTATGDIMITGGGSTEVPAGPYEVRISVDGKEYIIKTDASGNITAVIPGNILLELKQGHAVYSGNDIVKITSVSESGWALSGRINSLQCSNSDGNLIPVIIDSDTGDLRTTGSASAEINVKFNYTDSSGNIISYTLVVMNGNIISYMAEISEPGPDFDFSTVTNVRISLKVTDEKTGLPLGQVSINLLKSDGDLNWQGFTNSSGISLFTATVDSANQTANVVVTRAGYETLSCPIEGLGKLIEFGKNIAMKPFESVVIIDSDGDGVPDQDDEFPYDETGAKKITGVYTLAYEDLYPDKGDADFNDLVVRLTITEKIDSQNRLRQIDLKTKLLASGAGYRNQFRINIYGISYLLIENPKENSIYTLGSYYTNSSGRYRDCAEKVHTPITFERGLDRSLVAAMPYDPYIICNGVPGREVHLPFVKTDYTGKVLDSDGFPWGLLVPDNWSWPKEYSRIYNAYPEFDDWYLNSGSVNADWYLRPDSRYTYQR